MIDRIHSVNYSPAAVASASEDRKYAEQENIFGVLQWLAPTVYLPDREIVPESSGDEVVLSRIVVYEGEDGMYVAECPVIPGCVSQGSTKQEAFKNLKEAMALCLEVREERGMPLTADMLELKDAL